MITRKSLLKLFTFLMVVSLLIAACDRPLPSSNNNDNSQATVEAYPAAGESGQTEQPEPTRAVVEGGEAAGEPTESGQETTEGGEPTAGETPEGEAPAGETTAPEGGVAEGETSTETPTEATPTEGASEGVTEETPEAEPTAEGETPQETAPEATEGEQASQPETAQPTTQVTLPTTHTVVAGENLYRIGLQYGLSWVIIAQANHISNPDHIYAGQVLQIPSGDSVTGGQPEPTPMGTNYIVKPGDTLYKIAQQYGISWTEIAEANGLVNPNQIYAGQTLKIPVNTPAPAVNHVVQPGETLFQISLKYGIPWIVIADANHIAAPYWVYAGQTLVIPGGS